MNDFLWRVRHLRAWAGEKPYLWWSLLLSILTVALLYAPLPVVDGKPSDARIRLWGLLLQLLGIVTVWRDLTSNAAAFGVPSIGRSFMDWLRRAWPERTVHATAGVIEGAGASMSAHASVSWTMDANLPPEERLRRLESNVATLQNAMDQQAKLAESRERRVSERLEKEQYAREVLASEVKGKLQEAVVGNFGILAFGVVWLGVGTVLTAVAPEVVLMVQCDWNGLSAALWR